MKTVLRALGRWVLFPVVLCAGALVGLIAAATHPGRVIAHVRQRGWRAFGSFSPEERKVIVHLLAGIVCLALAALAAVLCGRLW